MKCLLNESTEDKLKTAAAKVFMEKGFDGTTTRDIAKEAGLNCALMNYYFRSKEKLFENVFSDMSRMFFHGLIEILNKPLGIREKIMEMIDHDFKMFKENPGLSNFIINELHRNPERLLQTTLQNSILHHEVFENQLKEAILAGQIRDIDFKHILILIPSNVQFIFLSKTMTKQMFNISEEAFEKFADDQIQIVKEMISAYLFSKVEAHDLVYEIVNPN